MPAGAMLELNGFYMTKWTIRHCLSRWEIVSSLLLSQFLQSIDRTSDLGEFVDGRAIMLKNIMSYMGEFVAAVGPFVSVPGHVCRWLSRYVLIHAVLPGRVSLRCVRLGPTVTPVGKGNIWHNTGPYQSFLCGPLLPMDLTHLYKKFK